MAFLFRISDNLFYWKTKGSVSFFFPVEIEELTNKVTAANNEKCEAQVKLGELQSSEVSREVSLEWNKIIRPTKTMLILLDDTLPTKPARLENENCCNMGLNQQKLLS